MKKLFVIFLMMSVTGIIFTQNLTFSGYFNSGIGVVVTNGDEEPAIGVFGVDSEQLGYRFRLNGSIQNEARTTGFRFRLQSQNELNRRENTYLSLPFAFGFMNFFENKLGFSVGIVDDNTWQTTDWWINDDAGEGLGILVKSSNLIDGLNLGFGTYLISQEGGSRNNQFSRSLNINHSLNISDVKYVISSSYTIADIFYLGASFRTANQAGDNDVENDNLGRHESSQLIGDFRFFLVPDLIAIFAFNIDNLQDFSEKGTITFSETFSYKISDEINIGLNTVQFISSNEDADISLLFNVWGSYAFGSIIPRLDLTFLQGGQIHGSNYHHRKGYSINYNTDMSVFSIRPSLRINLDSRTHFEIGNVTHMSNNDGESSMLNLLYLDFRWSF